MAVIRTPRCGQTGVCMTGHDWRMRPRSKCLPRETGVATITTEGRGLRRSKRSSAITERQNSSPAPNRSLFESPASADATVARDEQTMSMAVSGSRQHQAPTFAAPKHPGEIGALGRYRVLEELGRGGMGAVFLGYDSALERKVALKVMLPRYAADADSRERFLREARAAAMVKSDHVVTIFDVGEEQGMPFIAMEYLLGCPLDQHLKNKGDLPLAHALRIGRETAMGLAAAHELGLVHRDIKPSNLWLEAPQGRVKLLDFGLARAQSDDLQLTCTGTVVGTQIGRASCRERV